MDRVFAKLYETEVGQILVKIDEDDCVPECRIFFQPEGFGVCSTALTWKDLSEDEQWDNVDKTFNGLGEEECVKIVKKLIESYMQG